MLKIKDNIYCVGEGLDNAYLITGEKNALIETVTDVHAQSYIQNIEEIMPVSEIDFLIFTHTEPRCLESVQKIIEKNPDIEIIATIPTIKNLKEITNGAFNERIAKNNAVLDLGNGLTMRFVITPNLTCPDSMIIHLECNGTLFGGHLFASDSADKTDFTYQEEYYKNNLLPFRPFVAGAVSKIPNGTDTICPCRGSIISDSAEEFIKKYTDLVSEEEKTETTVAICCCAGEGYTAQMADIIADEICKNGINAVLVDAASQNISETLNSADALIFGTSTVHRNARKEIWDAVTVLNAVRVNGKPYFVFGSYGWSGEGLKLIHEHLRLLRMKPFMKPFGVLFNPSEKDARELRDIAKRFADEVQNISD